VTASAASSSSSPWSRHAWRCLRSGSSATCSAALSTAGSSPCSASSCCRGRPWPTQWCGAPPRTRWAASSGSSWSSLSWSTWAPTYGAAGSEEQEQPSGVREPSW